MVPVFHKWKWTHLHIYRTGKELWIQFSKKQQHCGKLDVCTLKCKHLYLCFRLTFIPDDNACGSHGSTFSYSIDQVSL